MTLKSIKSYGVKVGDEVRTDLFGGQLMECISDEDGEYLFRQDLYGEGSRTFLGLGVDEIQRVRVQLIVPGSEEPVWRKGKND